jgi:hypothetical protein
VVRRMLITVVQVSQHWRDTWTLPAFFHQKLHADCLLEGLQEEGRLRELLQLQLT